MNKLILSSIIVVVLLGFIGCSTVVPVNVPKLNPVPVNVVTNVVTNDVKVPVICRAGMKEKLNSRNGRIVLGVLALGVIVVSVKIMLKGK